MSNKLIKNKVEIKKINYWDKLINVTFVILILLFLANGIRIFNDSSRMGERTRKAKLGKDYFKEEIIISDKSYDVSYSGDSSVASYNYYLFYGLGWHDKLFVDKETYHKYDVNDRISAFTTDHTNYYFTLEETLNSDIFTNNEIHKCIEGLLGAGLLMIILYKVIKKKFGCI